MIRSFRSNFLYINIRFSQNRTLSTEHNDQIQSSLYISGRHELNSVLQPSFRPEFLRKTSKRLTTIHQTMKMRGLAIENNIDNNSLEEELNRFAELSEKLDNLKRKREKLLTKIKKSGSNGELDSKFTQTKQELLEVRKLFYELEDRLIPFLLSIPADIQIDVPKNCSEIIDQYSGSQTELIDKMGAINHMRLGYLNNISHSSIVGPNARYLIGDGGKYFYALSDYLSDHFNESLFIQFKGLDLVKSAVVEAVNNKSFKDDPFAIQTVDDESQRLHLVGDSSLESFCGWISKQPSQTLFSGCKWVQIGSSYERTMKQEHCVRATIMVDNNVEWKQSMDELYQIWWKSITNLGLRCKSTHCQADSLQPNESARYEISCWLHSMQEWIPIIKITHHGHYISQRLGLRDFTNKQLISSNLTLIPLLECLFEHNQDPTTGKISHPQCLSNYYL